MMSENGYKYSYNFDTTFFKAKFNFSLELNNNDIRIYNKHLSSIEIVQIEFKLLHDNKSFYLIKFAEKFSSFLSKKLRII